MKNKLNIVLLIPLLVIAQACNKNNNNSESNSKNEVSSSSEEQREFTYKELDKKTVYDKVLGGWIGHAIGMGSGFEYVVATDNVCETENGPVDGYTVDDKTAIVALADRYFETDGQICNGSIGVNSNKIHPLNDPRVIKDNVYSDDDMHVDILNQMIFRDYGPKLGNNDIASAWKFYDVADVGGGADTANLTKNSNYIAPYTGQSTYGSMGYWVTESWIENETLGMLFPYMYDLAEGYIDMFTQVQGDAYGYYLGKLTSYMYTLAYEYDDAKVIIEKAFDIMGKSNEVYDIYQYVKKCYQQKVSWRQACIGVVEKAVNCAKIKLSDTAGFSINANAGMIFIGLMYGENDFEQSIKITSLCGLDGDCTAATVGGLLGMMIGYDNLPSKYTSYLGKNSKYHNYTGTNSAAIGVYWGPFAYCGKNFPNTVTFDWIANLTVGNIEELIKAYNGKVNDTTYTIATTKHVGNGNVEIKNYSFEDGNTTNWYLNSDNENTTFTATKAAVHIGTYGGSLILGDINATAKVYQKVKLVKDYTYKVTIWVNGANDREFKLFASDSNNNFFKSYVNPLTISNRHMKAEMEFKANSDEMEIGVDFVKSFENCSSTTIFLDDFFVEDITRYVTNKNYQEIEAEDTTLVEYSSIINNDKYSSKKAAAIESDGSIETDFYSEDEVSQFRFYYENFSESLSTVAVYVDDILICNLPLVSNGINNSYNESNYAKIDIFVNKGNHKLKVVNVSFEDIIIDKFAVLNSNKLLES